MLPADGPAQVYKRGNGWFVRSDDELETALKQIGSADLPSMQRNSYELAQEILDYKVLAERVLR